MAAIPSNNIIIINVFDAINTGTYTFSSYFSDESTAHDTINRLANYWVTEHGGQYVGYVKDEDGFCVKKDEEFVMIYYIQTLVDFQLDNIADSI